MSGRAFVLPPFVPPDKPAPPNRRTAIVVLGVARSGTSALTRVLSLLGAALPAQIMQAGRGNESGHWEPLPLMVLNEAILFNLGRTWDDPVPPPPEWFATAAAAVCAEKMAEVIAAEYGDAPLPVIKDPRLCRLAPLLFAALARLDIAPRVILPLRHPAEVARSLEARDGTALARGERVWLIDMLAAEAASRPHRRVWIAYDQLLQDWRTVCLHVASQLGLAWPRPPDQAAAEIDRYLDPALRHFASDADASGATLRAVMAGEAAARLWEAAQYGLRQDETALQGEFDAVRALT